VLATPCRASALFSAAFIPALALACVALSHVGQRNERKELGHVLLQGAIAHLYKSKLALNHSKRMRYFGPIAVLSFSAVSIMASASFF